MRRVRLVCLTVKLTYAFALTVRFPTGPSQPLCTRVTFLQVPAPGKLATIHCSPVGLPHMGKTRK